VVPFGAALGKRGQYLILGTGLFQPLVAYFEISSG
jgi:hypothetical protein